MAKRNTLTEAQWLQIRNKWEYDPGEPSYLEAGRKAAEEFGFEAPSKSTIADRAARESWERRGTMAGINVAAQRKADRMAGSEGSETDGPDGSARAPDGHADVSGTKKAAAPSVPSDPVAAQSARVEAEDLRAQVIARHRQEWQQVAQLRQEALLKRPRTVGGVKVAGSVGEAFDAAKLAKITAEMTGIQQAGERKAWGLDVVIDPDQMRNLSDADLQAIAAGKAPGGR